MARFYTRTMAPDVELAERFGRADMDDQLGKIADDYQRLSDRAKSEKKRTALARRREHDIRDIAAMRDRLRGTYGAPADPNSPIVRTSRIARQLNYLRLLGGMMLSATVDLANMVMANGILRVAGDGIVPLVRNFRAFRLATNEVKLTGTAWDMVLDSRALNLADLGDDYGRLSRAERALTAATNNFGVLTLISPWNAAMKQFTGVVTSNRILETSAAWSRGKVRRGDSRKLAQMGIDRQMAERIAAEFTAHGETLDGVRIAHTERWTDRDAMLAFRAAVQKDVDATIVTPGIGDRPLWMSAELGKVIGQFRSFAFASTQRVFIARLQQRDAAALNGALLAVGLGMMVYASKTWLAGREVSDDPAVWVTEGVDRSGITGFLYDINNIVEKGSRGTVGVSALTGGPTMSRYASRSITGAVFGPSIGFSEDLVRLVGAGAVGDWRQSDTRAARRLVPYQNLFYARRLFDIAEEGANEALGVKR